ncbi:PAS domain-containing protein [Methylobacterium sp. CM6257]
MQQPTSVSVADPTRLGHERYTALVRAVATVVWTATPDGSTRVGADWTRLTGQSAEQMVGYGWLDAIHPEDRERTQEAWRTAVLHQGVFDTDYRILCEDGIYRWFNARGAPVLNRDGTIREWVGICLAITGSKRFQVDGASALHQRERITAGQVRAARAILGWSIADLSAKSDLSPSTIARIEDETRWQTIRLSNLNAARSAFEASGVTFTWTAGGEAGLHLRQPPES